MPLFELEIGGKLYEVEAPDMGAAAAAAKGIQQPQQQPQKPEQQQPWYAQAGQAADDIARLAANGLTFGFADKLAGYMGGEGTEAERKKSEEAQNRAGLAGTVAELGGSFLPIAKAAQAGATLTRLLPAGLTGAKGLAARTGALAAEGSGYGALSAVGHDQDVGQGAALGALAGAAGNVAGEGLSKSAQKLAGSFSKKPPTMSADDLRTAKDAAYRRTDDIGVRYTPQAFDDLIEGMSDELSASKLNPLRHPKAASMLEEIKAMSGDAPSLTQLDQLRQVVRRDVANAPDDAEKFFGQKMIRNIDDFINSAGQNQVITGGADEAASAINRARDLNTRLRKTEDVGEAVEAARLRAGSTGSGGNIDNATRQDLRQVLKKGKNWTPDERKAFEKVIIGTGGQNALRLAGKLSPQGSGLMAALGVGGAMANPMLGLPALAGIGAKAVADKSTSRAVEDLMRIIAAGGQKSATRAPKNAAQRLAESERESLARLLMTAGVTAGP